MNKIEVPADLAQRIGERIAEARERRDLSGQQLAAAIGRSKQGISQWEVGSRTVKVEDLWALCTALEVSADELLFGKVRWPFDKIDYHSVADLKKSDRDSLGGAVVYAAGLMGLEVKELAA